MSRSPKKSETLEVRLPYAAKTAFMARCQADGQTASEAVRRFIDSELEGAAPKARWRWGQAVAAALAGLALGAVAAPSLANTSSRAAFDHLDRNHDGAVSFEEYRAR
jgi:hypothetical protein